MGEEEAEAVSSVIRSGWIGLGPKTAEFERQLAQYIGVPYMIGLNSATAALHIAVRLLDIRYGDEVIVPTMTFVSTAHAVIYNRATVRFADVNEITLNIDPADVARKITPRTRAIVPVHYGGRPVDMDALREVTGDIPIIEDAAHAFGSEYRGQRAGSIGDIGCFSFHAVKNLATGDGGAVAVKDKARADRAKKLRWLGIDKGTWDRTDGGKTYMWDYDVDEIGLKCHMNDITAAIGLVQLQKLESMNARRREIAHMYDEGLCDLSWLQIPMPDSPDSKSSWHIYCIQADCRDELNEYLEAKGIGTGVHYRPIHMYSTYKDRVSLPKAERAFRRILSLPMHPGLKDEEVEFIVDSIRAFSPPC